MTQVSRMFYMPTRIVHGLGCVADLAGQVRAVGGGKAFVCTDTGLTAAGVTATRDVAPRRRPTLPFVVFDDVKEDPGVQTVAAGVERFRGGGCDVVVALGGGSPMCAGKGIALVAANGGMLTDYEGFNKAAEAAVPGHRHPDHGRLGDRGLEGHDPHRRGARLQDVDPRRAHLPEGGDPRRRP